MVQRSWAFHDFVDPYHIALCFRQSWMHTVPVFLKDWDTCWPQNISLQHPSGPPLGNCYCGSYRPRLWKCSVLHICVLSVQEPKEKAKCAVNLCISLLKQLREQVIWIQSQLTKNLLLVHKQRLQCYREQTTELYMCQATWLSPSHWKYFLRDESHQKHWFATFWIFSLGNVKSLLSYKTPIVTLEMWSLFNHI